MNNSIQDIKSIIIMAQKRLSEKEFDCAIECTDYAIQNQAYLFEAYFIKGCALYYKKNYNEAFVSFKSASSFCYNSESLNINIMKSAILSGQNIFDCLNVKMNSHPNAGSDLYMLSGIIAYKLNNYSDGQKYFSAAHKLFPNSSAIYTNAGISMLEKQNVEEKDISQAVCCFTKAIAIMPLNKFAYYNRAKAYILQKKYNYALNDTQMLLYIDYDDAGYHYIRATALELSGKYNMAYNEYKISALCNNEYIKNESINKMKVLKKRFS